MKKYLNCLLSLLILIHVDGVDPKGSVGLDIFTFDKVLNKHEYTILKIDTMYPYGEKQDEFEKLSISCNISPNILVAHIGVADYGEKENSALAERFDVKKEDFPTYILFTDFGKKHQKYNETSYKADDIKEFILKNTKVWIGLTGCLEVFDKLAKEFVQATDKKTVFSKAEKELEKVEETDKFSGRYYVKSMEKGIAKGNQFFTDEYQRLKEMVAKGNAKAEKLEEFKKKINILKVFLFKDEL